MSSYLFFKYLHFVSIFILVGSVFVQNFLISKELTLKEIKRIAISDAFYGVSAVAVAVIGLVLWFGVGKPADFYNMNFIFHIKIGLFFLIAIFSIAPTMFYLKNRKRLKEGQTVSVPRGIMFIVRMELILLLFIPLLAVLMANGVGYFG